jgi:hypothetical protein
MHNENSGKRQSGNLVTRPFSELSPLPPPPSQKPSISGAALNIVKEEFDDIGQLLGRVLSPSPFFVYKLFSVLYTCFS